MRWIVRSVVAVVVATLLVIGALFFVPTDRVAQLAASQFDRSTGRALTITGDVRPSFWPSLGVTTGPVSVANADWSDNGPMFAAQSLSIGVDLQSLWGGDIRITGIEATDAAILLERHADGRANWEFGTATGAADTATAQAGTRQFTLDQGTLRNASITFIDHSSGQQTSLTGIDADLALPEFNGPATVTLSGQMGGQDITAALTLNTFGPALSGAVTPVRVAATAGVAKIAFTGRIGTSPFMAEGDLDADLGNLRDLSTLIGQAKPDLPQGFGANRVAVKGRMTLTGEGTAHLRGGTIRLDDTTLTGDVDYAPGEARPRISAKIVAGDLNLASLSGGGGATPAPSAGWSKDRIDVSALGLMDATVALEAASVDLGTLKLGQTRGVMTLDRGRAVFDLTWIAAYGGAASGQFVVNGRDGLSVGGDLALTGIALQPLLAAIAGSDRLIGTADLRLSFLGVGNSLHEIMQTLSGQGSLGIGQGELRGFDLAGMLRTMDPGFVGEGAKTIFDGITGSFDIKDGIARNRDLVLASPLVQVDGRGRVDLGQQTLDYRVVPRALRAADGTGGLKVPLDITGPWSDLSYKLDVEAMTGVDVDEEVKDRLADEARDRLGITPRKGESLGDAAQRRAQRKLEREAARAMERLLGGN